MDVDAAAAANAAVWRARADDEVAATPELADFREAAAATAFGTNVDAHKMGHFLGRQPPALVPALAVRQASQDEQSGWDAVYVEGEWGPRRLAVEDGLGAVGRVVYGTLDFPRCVGDDGYGLYRIVLRPTEEDAPIVLPHNSASGYALDGTLDVVRLHADVAEWASRSDVMTLTHGDRASQRHEREWPALMAESLTDGDVEADLTEVLLRQGARPLDDVEVVRVAEERLVAALTPALDVLASTEDRPRLEEGARVASDVTAASDRGDLNLDIVPAGAA